MHSKEKKEQLKEEILYRYYTQVGEREYRCDRCGKQVHVGETRHGQEEFLLHETEHNLKCESCGQLVCNCE